MEALYFITLYHIFYPKAQTQAPGLDDTVLYIKRLSTLFPCMFIDENI